MIEKTPSVARFEAAIHESRFDDATSEAVLILEKLNNSNGVLNDFDLGVPFTQGGERELYVHFATRFAAAYGSLVTAGFADISAHALEAMLILHRWTDIMFRLSGFQSSSYILPRLPHDQDGRFFLTSQSVSQLQLFFSPSADVAINFDECAQANGVGTIIALLGYLAARSCISENAVALRDRILEWLPGKMDGVHLGAMQLSFVTEGYMHCSYAFTRSKHQIKADFIRQLHRALIAEGAIEIAAPPPRRERPIIVVVCEHFHSQHSVYRTHSRAVRALKDKFEVIGVGYSDRVDQAARDCFDRFIGYPDGELIASVKRTADTILQIQPDIVFHLGVGMANHVVALASLRLAPVQCVSYGHTATTMSPAIDYMILPEDFIGAEDVYSETLVKVPAAAIPYALPEATEAAVPPRRQRESRGVVRIAVPASIMKINARFLEALANGAAAAKCPVEFHFFPLGALGFSFYHLELEIRRVVPEAIVYAQSDRTTYLERLGRCDFFVSPFPYGNMNSIVDAMHMALPGVCLDGDEAHSHADLAFFRRLGLPEELCTRTIDEYIAAIVRLADDREWLLKCQDITANIDLASTIYAGDESLFCNEMVKLLALVATEPAD
jgi:hypothetical protein